MPDDFAQVSAGPDPFSSPAAPLTLPGKPKIEERRRPKYEPLWYVVLHDDDVHTYAYVIEMLITLFGMTPQRALLHAMEVDTQGVTIVARLPKSEAADKRDQIMRFGGDPRMGTTVSMRASIEPCDD